MEGASSAAPSASAERTDQELLDMWETFPLARRPELVPLLKTRGLIPVFDPNPEPEYGVYPDIDDVNFTQKLLQKREFSEQRQPKLGHKMKKGTDAEGKEIETEDYVTDDKGRKQYILDGKDICKSSDEEFELSPVQRFIGRFMSPECPYTSALLYYGVGVGKTCAAVTIAENHLRMYSRRQVFIVAPRTIQSGFKRTIFDDEGLVIPEAEDEPNLAKGCTGNAYLKRTGSELEKERSTIQRRVAMAINSRYKIMGYIQFHRYIESILNSVSPTLEGEEKTAAQMEALKREFSGRLVIIDEAHNLRDNPRETTEENLDTAGGDTEETESQAGKRLTPSLLKVLDAAESMKLVLMTATPMYNSHVEIIFLLNLLLKNDKKAQFLEDSMFDRAGRLTPEGREALGNVAKKYVSFMRGENPMSFPARLQPRRIKLQAWPAQNLKGEDLTEQQGVSMLKLPFVGVEYDGDAYDKYVEITNDAVERGLSLPALNEMAQAGNWIFPAEDGLNIRDSGFDGCFEDIGGGKSLSSFRARGDAKWLLENELMKSSPKAHLVLQRAATCNGVIFVYSRFLKSGALPLALTLEANGYTAWGRDRPLFASGVQDGKGLACAYCALRQKEHAKAKHAFKPAKYILITGQAALSPNNPAAIAAARAKANVDGGEIKVIIGSQVASEGVDLRFVREIYVFDAWFHLNKMEQVLGRGVRTCSHALIEDERKRNCTIHLLVNTFADNGQETADMYMYRTALEKAQLVGRVTRALKEYALDCNLNRDAIIINNLKPRVQIDAQGFTYTDVNINDTPFTSICDWIETCDYECAVKVDFTKDDLSSYDDFAARWHESQLKRAIRLLFETQQQPSFSIENITEMFTAVPPRAIAALLAEIVGNKSFRLRIRGREGYIEYRNGYYVFQPIGLSDLRIPLAMRIADIPMRRDAYEATEIVIRREGIAAAAAAAPAPTMGVSGAAPAAAGEAAEPEGALEYWTQIKTWAASIIGGTAPLDVPPDIVNAYKARYTAPSDQAEVRDQCIMISWLYEDIRNNPEVRDEDRESFRRALARAVLEYAWDQQFKPAEQQLILKEDTDEITRAIAEEQLVSKGGTDAFRYIDAITGVTKYMCKDGPCSEAVARVFEGNREDPLSGIAVNTTNTGQIYGFIVPKAKDKRLVFKTSTGPPPPGGKPDKGSECGNISTISYHIKMLKDIAEIMKARGYPTFILRPDVLDEKERRKEERAKLKAERPGAVILPVRKKDRSFENATKACALKELILRWLDVIERGRGGGGAGAPTRMRFFYRPIASSKTGHKGAVSK